MSVQSKIYEEALRQKERVSNSTPKPSKPSQTVTSKRSCEICGHSHECPVDGRLHVKLI